jgi:hypothetical protein
VTESESTLSAQLASGATRIDCASCARIPASFLAEAARRSGTATPLLANVHGDARAALHVLGLSQRFKVDSPTHPPIPDLPFKVGLEGAGVIIVVDRAIAQNKLLDDPISHAWVRGLAADFITLDFGIVDHVNSMLVAWLLQLAQSAKPARVRLRNTKPQVQTQVKQLRLDQMMDIG